MSARATRITSKGQVVIPKEIRDRTGLDIGDSVSLTSGEEGIRVVKRSGWARATAGTLPSPGGPIEPEELEAVLERAKDAEIVEEYMNAT